MEESKRQKKYGRLIQKELSEIFQKNAHSHYGGTFITVTYVKMTPDLALSRIYLSFLLAPDEKALFNQIKESIKQLRGELGRKIGKQVRIVPNLEFFMDNTQEEADRIEKLFQGIDIPPAEDSEE